MHDIKEHYDFFHWHHEALNRYKMIFCLQIVMYFFWKHILSCGKSISSTIKDIQVVPVLTLVDIPITFFFTGNYLITFLL